MKRTGLTLSAWALCACLAAPSIAAQAPKSNAVLFENVRIFDGVADSLSAPSHVLVVDNLIQRISATPINPPEGAALTTIQGNGATLMPGMIDAHTHLMMSTVPMMDLLSSDVVFAAVAATRGADDMLQRGFTSARDLGGPVFGLKRAIDRGIVNGPRIWPSGATISQTAGHGDFRLPNELPARPGDHGYPERVNYTALADGVPAVLQRTREQLGLGASQIKVMAGGGVSSFYDPLDVNQYTPEEMRAAVNAASNWGTYVAVHAYTPQTVRQAIDAGVKVIEHGQLLDEPTLKLMAEKGVWLSLQPFLDDQDSIPFPDGSVNRVKQLQMTAGTDNAYKWAKQYGVKIAWGTDTLFDARLATRQNAQLTKLTRWYSPAEILRMATSGNAELLALSGPRNPYPGKLGVIQEGALADLLLVSGDPLADLSVLENPQQNFRVIMKNGTLFKHLK